MKRVVWVALLMLFWTTTGLAAPSENYLGIRIAKFALTIKEFDAAAPAPGALEFAKVSTVGGIRPQFFLAPAMQSGWDVSFDEAGIKSNALLVFHNPEKNSSILTLAQRDSERLNLRWYHNGAANNQTFTNIEEVEKLFDHQFIGAVNSSKHKVRWGSSALYSNYYDGAALAYTFRLYGKYSGRLRLQDNERGLDGILYALIERGMPSTTKVRDLKAGSIVNMVGRGKAITEIGGLMFVTHVDAKNELIYYTYLGSGNSPAIAVTSFADLQQRMKTAILPEKMVATPIIFK